MMEDKLELIQRLMTILTIVAQQKEMEQQVSLQKLTYILAELKRRKETENSKVFVEVIKESKDMLTSKPTLKDLETSKLQLKYEKIAFIEMGICAFLVSLPAVLFIFWVIYKV